MDKLETLRVLEDDLGEVARSRITGSSLYYSARWGEVATRAGHVARQLHLSEPNDVQVADYALNLLGIPNRHVETELDEMGDWVIYWS